jgi:hypothetical protein
LGFAISQIILNHLTEHYGTGIIVISAAFCAHDISESGLSFLGLRNRQYQVEALLKTPL